MYLHGKGRIPGTNRQGANQCWMRIKTGIRQRKEEVSRCAWSIRAFNRCSVSLGIHMIEYQIIVHGNRIPNQDCTNSHRSTSCARSGGTIICVCTGNTEYCPGHSGRQRSVARGSNTQSFSKRSIVAVDTRIAFAGAWVNGVKLRTTAGDVDCHGF